MSSDLGRFDGACVHLEMQGNVPFVVMTDNADGQRLAGVIDPSGRFTAHRYSSVAGNDVILIRLSAEVDQRVCELIDLLAMVRYNATSVLQFSFFSEDVKVRV